MAEARTSSERIDNLPSLIDWLKQMQVDVIIDRVLGPPHGNWEGLSYGEEALVFVAHVVSACTHFLSPMQEWARTHLQSLSQALGKPVRAEDFSDDRLAILLSRLGGEATQSGAQIERELGQQVLRAYALPSDTARIDRLDVYVQAGPVWQEFLATQFAASVQEGFGDPSRGFPIRTILSRSKFHALGATVAVIALSEP